MGLNEFVQCATSKVLIYALILLISAGHQLQEVKWVNKACNKPCIIIIYIYTHYHSILQVLSHDYPHHTIFIPIILYIFAVVIFGATINCIMEVENNPL